MFPKNKNHPEFRVCHACREKIPFLDVNCPECGVEIREAKRIFEESLASGNPDLVCNQCGAQLPEGSKFCNSCGQEVATTRAVAQPRPPLGPRNENNRPFLGGWALWGTGVGVSALIIILAIVVGLTGDDSSANLASNPTASKVRTPVTSRPAVIPADVTYSIHQQDTRPGIKRTVDVKLSRKVSEEVLRAIAYEVKNADPKTYERTFIFYYPPETKLSGSWGAWATTHFNPGLEVQILGLTAEEATGLRDAPFDTSREVVGSWLSEEFSTRFTLYHHEGRHFIENMREPGGSIEQELWEVADSNPKRFDSFPPKTAIPAPDSTPGREILTKYLQELLGFKDSAQFNQVGFGTCGPYGRWLDEIKQLRDDPSLTFDEKVAASYLMQLGMGYIHFDQKNGLEDDDTIYFRIEFDNYLDGTRKEQTDYYLINDLGNLEIWDEHGLVTTAAQIYMVPKDVGVSAIPTPISIPTGIPIPASPYTPNPGITASLEPVTLTPSPGKGSTAMNINNAGQVVGSLQAESGETHAFLWTPPDQLKDLGAPDTNAPGGNVSIAYAINESGQVAGMFGVPRPSGGRTTIAFLWTPELGMTALPHLGGFSAGVNDINDHGQMVGYSRDSDQGGGLRAVLWTAEGEIKDLGTLGGSDSTAHGINNLGQVVGSARGASRKYLVSHAFLWTADSGMVSLGALDANHTSVAYAINDLGQVVGESVSKVGDSASRCFLWTKEGGMIDIGTLLGGDRCVAKGINNLGQVVGWSDVSGNPNRPLYHAFLWTPESGMMDLGESEPEPRSYAYAVNDSGEIAGAWRCVRGEEFTCSSVKWQASPAPTSSISPAAATATPAPTPTRAHTKRIPPTLRGKASFGDGTFRVGIDIQAGTYSAPGSDLCYWERISGFGGSFGEIIANNAASGPAIVTIQLSDAGFTSQRCGTWIK